MLPLPDNTPYSPVGIIGVPMIPWDNMYMAVHDTLSGDPAGIKTDIVAVRCVLLIDDLFGSIKDFKKGVFFFRCCVKTILYVAEGDDEHMPFLRPGTCPGVHTGTRFLLV